MVCFYLLDRDLYHCHWFGIVIMSNGVMTASFTFLYTVFVTVPIHVYLSWSGLNFLSWRRLMIFNRIWSYFDMAVVVVLFIFWTSRDVSTLFGYCSITSSLCRFMSFYHDPVYIWFSDNWQFYSCRWDTDTFSFYQFMSTSFYLRYTYRHQVTQKKFKNS